MQEPQPCTTEWAQDQVEKYAKRRGDYQRLEAVLREVLELAAEKFAPLAIVQVRTKTIPSFAEKCLRKCRKRTEPVDQFTDLCGGRIIVHTQEQVERISRFLEEYFDIDWTNSEDMGRRLKTTEFGYRSVHYIVTFKKGAFPTRDFPVDVPARLCGGEEGMQNPRAEIQVRTLLQHAWADIGHDLLYKGGFEAPEAWQREYHRFAAMLETADEAVSGVHGRLRRFVSSYGAYMSSTDMEEELRLLDFVRRYDPDDVGLALRIAGVANAAERWNEAIDALESHESDTLPAVMYALGVALCGRGRGRPLEETYRRGQQLLELAADDPETRESALLALADTWRGVDDDAAYETFSRAFKADPDDPYALAGYLEYRIARDRHLDAIPAARPAIETAIRTCHSRTRASVDVPRGYFAAGFFSILMGDGYAAVDAYAKGIEQATVASQIAGALDALQRIACADGELEGLPWAARMLQLGLAARYKDQAAREALHRLATGGADRLAKPLVIVAGGCDPQLADRFEPYRELLVGGLSQYRGTVVSGGTREGVSGFVGEAAERNPGISAVSYLPQYLPNDATRDPRYAHSWTVKDEVGFTPMAPLQAWTDTIAAGIDPADVRLLGINGGDISAGEYRIALALGATVALVEESGRAAAKMPLDEEWCGSQRLLSMPADAATVRAYLGAELEPVPEDLLAAVARDLHEEYRRDRQKEVQSSDPGLAEWDDLVAQFRHSSMASASEVFAKLAAVDLEAVPAAGAQPEIYVIPDEEVEYLAELEHGRWNVERLLEGWRYGPEKDIGKRITPYLVTWTQLPDKIREYDRDFVRVIPKTLAKHGYEVRKKE